MNQPYKVSDVGKDSDDDLQTDIQTAECVRELGAIFMAGSPGTELGDKRFIVTCGMVFKFNVTIPVT